MKGLIARAGSALLACGALAGCAQTDTVRTSADTAIVEASAAPVCGSAGAARVAQRQAAIETLRAGYDRYVIVGSDASSNVSLVQMPGTYNTTGTLRGGFLNAQTTYTPGPTFVAGRHNRSFAVKMFRDGEPGADRALSARETLGPKWAEAIKSGSMTTC